MSDENKPEETSEEELDEDDNNLWFTNARIVRLIKDENPGRIIKSQVKMEMNKLLEGIGRTIAKDMAKKPYSTLTYTDFLEAAKPYLELAKINQERRKVVATLKKIAEDCNSLSMDLEEKTQETDYYFTK